MKSKKKKKEVLMRQAEYARKIGVERQYITQLIKEGKLKTKTIVGIKLIIVEK